MNFFLIHVLLYAVIQTINTQCETLVCMRQIFWQRLLQLCKVKRWYWQKNLTIPVSRQTYYKKGLIWWCSAGNIKNTTLYCKTNNLLYTKLLYFRKFTGETYDFPCWLPYWFPTDFYSILLILFMRSQPGSDHVTAECCSCRKCEPVANHPYPEHMTVRCWDGHILRTGHKYNYFRTIVTSNGC